MITIINHEQNYHKHDHRARLRITLIITTTGRGGILIFFSAKKVALDVLSSDNFIINKPIKTKQNVKHINGKGRIVGGEFCCCTD